MVMFKSFLNLSKGDKKGKRGSSSEEVESRAHNVTRRQMHGTW
jgi:hypothetical protein